MNTALGQGITVGLITYIILSSPVFAAADCDCTVVTGRCEGAVEFLKSYGSNKNYGAEINVHSSEQACSKVDYYVSGTPYTTVLNNKNSQVESLFGTRPIKQSDVKFNACHVCKKTGASDKPGTSTPAAAVDKFTGTWRGVRKSNLGFSKQMTVDIQKQSGNRVTMLITEDNDRYNASGTVLNDVLTFGISGGCDGTIKLSGPGNASYECALGIFTASASLKK